MKKLQIAKSFLTQLNAARQENEKRPLELDPTINNFAETKANEQLILYGHTRPNGQDFNYGECIARESLNTSVSEAAKEALNDFLYNDAGS
ncbi:CAP domain-containing protein [uncultured Lactobacillus sp.]|uniref:CAP domain-containing protein n=1 Tax=uncultured Lactobacillus sp. TaxID=153152 RepID=UPI003455594E